MSKDHDFVCEFLEIYKSKTCLWKKTDPNYHNWNIREAAYGLLLAKYQEYDEKATKASVKSKINSLRTTYNKEYKKVKDSERSVAGIEEVYKPSLWYYDLMSFINDNLPSRASAICKGDDKQKAEDSQSSNTDGLDDVCPEQEQSDRDFSMPTHIPSPGSSGSKRLLDSGKTKLISDTKVLQLMAERLKNTDDVVRVGRHDSFGRHIADELNSIPPDMLPYVKKIINLAIFEGHMRTLNASSSIVTQQSQSVIQSSIPPPLQDSSGQATQGLHVKRV